MICFMCFHRSTHAVGMMRAGGKCFHCVLACWAPASQRFHPHQQEVPAGEGRMACMQGINDPQSDCPRAWRTRPLIRRWSDALALTPTILRHDTSCSKLRRGTLACFATDPWLHMCIPSLVRPTSVICGQALNKKNLDQASLVKLMLKHWLIAPGPHPG